MAFHHISLTYGGWLGMGTSLLEGMEGRHPRLAWASCKPSASTKAQHIQGPRDRLKEKTWNINTACILVWPSEACERQRAFPRAVILMCLQEQSTHTEGCKTSLSHRFGPPACVLDVSVCLLESLGRKRRCTADPVLCSKLVIIAEECPQKPQG